MKYMIHESSGYECWSVFTKQSRSTNWLLNCGLHLIPWMMNVVQTRPCAPCLSCRTSTACEVPAGVEVHDNLNSSKLLFLVFDSLHICLYFYFSNSKQSFQNPLHHTRKWIMCPLESLRVSSSQVVHISSTPHPLIKPPHSSYQHKISILSQISYQHNF